MIHAPTDSGNKVPSDKGFKLLGAAFSAGLALVFYGLFLNRGVAPSVVGYNLVPAERILAGDVPYRDFLYNYTPGVLWLNAVLFRLLGTSLMTARVGVYTAKVVSAVFLYLIGTRYLHRWLALVPVLMMLAWIGYGDLLKVFPTQYGMPFLLGAWLCMLKAVESPPGRGRTVWLTATGLFVGLVFIFKQNVGVFLLAAGCISVLGFEKTAGSRAAAVVTASKRALLVATGFAVPVGAMSTYLASHRAFVPMISHFFRHAAAYEEAKGIALPEPSVLLVSLAIGLIIAGIAFGIDRIYPRSAAAWLALALGALMAIVLWNGGKGGRGDAIYQSLVAEVYYLPIYAAIAGLVLYLKKGKLWRSAPVLIGLLFALGAFLEIVPRSDADHLARVLPASFVLGCGLLAAAVDSGNGWISNHVESDIGQTSNARKVIRSAEVVFLGVSVLVITLGVRVTWAPQFDGGLHFRDRDPLTFERGSGVMDVPSEAVMLNDAVRFVQQSTGPDDQILAISRKITSIYFFAARPNTTRLEWFDSPGVPAADREDIFTRVADRKFKLILFGEDLSEMTRGDKNDIARYQDRLLGLLPENYNRAAVIDGVTCFTPR
jgi:hypothetical protein